MASHAEETGYLMESFPSLEGVGDPDRTASALRKLFDSFLRQVIPNADFTLAQLTRFVESLVRNQRGAGSFIVEPGSWSLISLDEDAPSDVRVDYIFYPTYYAVSLLTLFLHCYPEQAERIKGYKEALHKGLRFAGMRGLLGHGLEAREQREEAVRILMRGEVPEYLVDNVNNYPECRPLLEAILDYAAELEKRIDPEIVRIYIRLSDLKQLLS